MKYGEIQHEMKLLFVVASLLASVNALSIGLPLPGTTLSPGQTTTVRIIVHQFLVRVNF